MIYTKVTQLIFLHNRDDWCTVQRVCPIYHLFIYLLVCFAFSVPSNIRLHLYRFYSLRVEEILQSIVPLASSFENSFTKCLSKLLTSLTASTKRHLLCIIISLLLFKSGGLILVVLVIIGLAHFTVSLTSLKP